jgi:hypothetical protein
MLRTLACHEGVSVPSSSPLAVPLVLAMRRSQRHRILPRRRCQQGENNHHRLDRLPSLVALACSRVWENYKVETVQLQSQLQKITLRVPTRRNILKHDVIPTVSLDEAVAREGVGSRSRGRRE